MKHKDAKPSPAREKLLRAGALVFAQQGLQGATTRMIAQEAGVNEVTLFRLFESKERLLAEVLANERQSLCDTLAQKTAWTQDLRADLRAFAQAYNAMLEKNEAMIRTLIGESRRQPLHAKQVIHEAMRPTRESFISYLTQAREEGRVRSDLNVPAAVDMFTGTLLGGMLKRTGHGSGEYTSREHLETCVEIFVAGTAAQGGGKEKAKQAAARRAVAKPRSTTLARAEARTTKPMRAL